MTYPGIPLDFHISLTFRCNNDCLHCGLRSSPDDLCRMRELTFSEIRRIVDEIRCIGSCNWSISGGESMLRPDFSEIFEYISSHSSACSLSANATLITQEIADLMARKGNHIVTMYGATPETYKKVTRNPDGFEQFMQGVRYLQESGAGFIVQLIPTKDNWHEWGLMVELARTLSPRWRVGASWRFLSCHRNEQISLFAESEQQEPKYVVQSAQPGPLKDEPDDQIAVDSYLADSCRAGGQHFHIDPYGIMTLCPVTKNSVHRYDLRGGTVEEGLKTFLPSFDGLNAYSSDCETFELEPAHSCDSCACCGLLDSRQNAVSETEQSGDTGDIRWIEEAWTQSHCRYFRIADITIKLDSDLPVKDTTFEPRFKSFAVEEAGEDTVSIYQHFGIPDLRGKDFGRELYHKAPWLISMKNNSYIYRGISTEPDDLSLHQLAVCSSDHNCMSIYNNRFYEEAWTTGGLHSLTMFPSDQVLIARLLADRQGFYLHSAGAIVNGAGMLFVGHSEAGKSTTTNILIEAGSSGGLDVEILCDDRNIVRRKSEGWRVYGTWHHGDVPRVSSATAPLKAVCFIEKADFNRIEPLEDRNEITRRLLACLIRPFITAEWWEKTFDHVAMMVNEAPFYRMQFDKSGNIVDEIVRIANGQSNVVS
jgi:MoaA/NifB/PqqE/SkfB family radical SAM enzyme